MFKKSIKSGPVLGPKRGPKKGPKSRGGYLGFLREKKGGAAFFTGVILAFLRKTRVLRMIFRFLDPKFIDFGLKPDRDPSFFDFLTTPLLGSLFSNSDFSIKSIKSGPEDKTGPIF